jgi:transposase
VYCNKPELINQCERLGLDASGTKAVLVERLRVYIAEHVLPEVKQMAEQRGHTLLYTPPYHSDLEPIEFVWAAMKGEVGGAYNSTTTFTDVGQRIQLAGQQVTSELVENCIAAARRYGELLMQPHEWQKDADFHEFTSDEDLEEDGDSDLTPEEPSSDDD